ncbi:MAG: hypothetical protein KJ907_14385 [Actinobacteria bacterium]|nr:hypothetical protein [Patescibacteria group bacterium]MBU4403906.1 hypothetical protein [Actinomycetota bacterium]MCG2696654.1 hypothetical protein [Candidatus Parcubacteria bacterium]MBU4309778.1 hypothetical protein [Patescibacteria group bacterium]MBU4431784.1 hypothetical protein [Patescibacteria group bacterium]
MDNQVEKNNKIKEAITRVVAFFDVFEFPPTVMEIWKFCDYQCGLDEILTFLNDEGDFLEEKDGFYFLPGRESLYEQRRERGIIAKKKQKKALKIARIFSFIPWIKMIAISNVIGSDNMKEESDIDLFIVTEHKRIWITRFFAVVLVKLLGLRPTLNNVRDKICLSFFVTTENLNLQKLMMADDVYFYFWLANLLPIYCRDNYYYKLIQANNWFLDKMPNWSEAVTENDLMIRRESSVFYRDVIDLFIGGLDINLKNYQLKVMSPVLKELMNKDTRVVINDGVLKLISNDRREYYKNLYLIKLRQLDSEIAGQLK